MSQTVTVLHDLATEFCSRKLLLQPPIYESSAASSPLPAASTGLTTGGEPYGENGFDANVVMVLSVLLCALVCSLGLNSIVRCALRCSHLVAAQSASTSILAANTGMKKKVIKRIPTMNYSDGLNLQHLDTECAICLSEFAQGERVRVLPKCNHGFHVRCIDKWLNAHSSCPTCRYSLMEKCQKKTNCSQSSSSATFPPLPAQTPTIAASQETVASISPLHPEPVIASL